MVMMMRRPPLGPRKRSGAGSGVVYVEGMGGMGDNLHQRAVVRELMRTHTVYLQTPWPSIYHDLVGDKLKLVRKPTRLRTQAKNMGRQSALFTGAPTVFERSMSVWYARDDVVSEGSVLGAMCKSAKVTERDFSMPVPVEWKTAAANLAQMWDWDSNWNGKPLLLYRPLVARTEWGGCAARNPDYDAYAEIFRAIRGRFFVVSVADLVPRTEWVVGHDVHADLELHQGELTFEALAGLMAMASMSYASPGFATILAQAVGTPSICIFGGYENSSSFSGGAHLAPYLGIDPIKPCSCFQHTHPCQKQIDVPRAIARVTQFVEQYCHGHDHSEPAVARPCSVHHQNEDPAGSSAADPGRLEHPV